MAAATCMLTRGGRGVVKVRLGVSSVLHTENVAGGQTEFPKCRGGGGESVYDVLTFQKSRGTLVAYIGYCDHNSYNMYNGPTVLQYSHLSSLFSMKIEKRALRLVSLPCV